MFLQIRSVAETVSVLLVDIVYQGWWVTSTWHAARLEYEGVGSLVAFARRIELEGYVRCLAGFQPIA